MSILKKQLPLAAIIISAMALLFSSSAFAHVVVKPAEVLTGAFQTFTTSVPNEKEIATTKVKLIIPNNLEHVSPTVKPGWTIKVEKEGEGEAAVVKSITWSEGAIPTGQRDDFTFSAKAPEKTSELQWKAYQTYRDGEVVAWDQNPSSNHDDKTVKPFSVTKVVSSLTDASGASDDGHAEKADKNTAGTTLAVAALVIAFVALLASTRKPQVSAKKK